MNKRTLAAIVCAALLTCAGTAQATDYSGHITSSATWTTSDAPHIVDTVWVDSGVTLTIAAGVSVEFDADVPFYVNGALFVEGTSGSPVTFAPGTAPEWGGIRIAGGDSSNIHYATISRAVSAEIGGGIAVTDTTTKAVLDNVTVEHCKATSGGGVAVTAGGWLSMSASTVQACSTSSLDGAGVYANLASTLLVSGSTVRNNYSARTGGGILYIGGNTDVDIIDCDIYGNESVLAAGGLGLYTGNQSGYEVYVLLQDSRVYNNVSGDRGGGLHVYHISSMDTSTVTIDNCSFYDNVADVTGGGIRADGGTGDAFTALYLNRCTVSGNTAGTTGGGIALKRGNTILLGTITNSIVYGNVASSLPSIYIEYSNVPIVSYSDIEGGWTYTGTGNIDADPLFTDASNDDYTLQLTSPCIDTGDPESDPDPDGTRADMGAYPYSHSETVSIASTNSTGNIVVNGTATGLYAADLAFIIESDSAVAEDDLVIWDAFEGKASRQASWRSSGDTVFVSVGAAESVTLSDEMLVNLAFDVQSAGDVFVRWLNYPYTTFDENPVGLIDGTVTLSLDTSSVWGDASGNGTLAAYDASLIIQKAVGKTVTIASDSLADVSGNGSITGYDAILVMNKVLTPSYVFPAEGGSALKPASGTTRELTWQRDAEGWYLTINDASGVLSLDAMLRLPANLDATVSGGTLQASRVVDGTMYISLIRDASENTVLLRLESDDVIESAPGILTASLNEGLIPAVTEALPTAFAVAQNAPNPFNPSTTIRFDLPSESMIQLSVYNLNGQLVRTLVNDVVPAGFHAVTWNGTDMVGRSVASGVYVYRLVSDLGVTTNRMTLMR